MSHSARIVGGRATETHKGSVRTRERTTGWARRKYVKEGDSISSRSNSLISLPASVAVWLLFPPLPSARSPSTGRTNAPTLRHSCAESVSPRRRKRRGRNCEATRVARATGRYCTTAGVGSDGVARGAGAGEGAGVSAAVGEDEDDDVPCCATIADCSQFHPHPKTALSAPCGTEPTSSPPK